MLLTAACSTDTDDGAPAGADAGARKRKPGAPEASSSPAGTSGSASAVKPVLRFAFAVPGTEQVLVLSSLEDPAEVVFEARDGEQGEVLRSAKRRENDRDRSYCEVRTASGQGWVPEEYLANVHWETAADRVADGEAGRRVTVPSEARAEPAPPPPRITVEEESIDTPAAALDAAAAAEPAAVPDVLSYSPAGSDEPFDSSKLIVRGQYTIIDFYSDHCGPCRRLAPRLEALATSHSRVVLRKVDVDRPGSTAIDWGSPIVAQYGIHSLPHVELYGPDGTLEGSDQQALALLDQLASQR